MNVQTDPALAEFAAYSARLQGALRQADLRAIGELAGAMRDCWRTDRCVYLCGNGGSAGNATHLANDFVYGIAKGRGAGMRAHALAANSSILTCLANDLDYSEIYSAQLRVYGRKGDLLIALSGSGNSPNILKALETARALQMKSFAVLGYSGGKALKMADVAIHFPIDDMQIAEDLQLVVGHMIMQWLYANPGS
jgi:D-sedoheptulose 7-phosphate isomerase